MSKQNKTYTTDLLTEKTEEEVKADAKSTFEMWKKHREEFKGHWAIGMSDEDLMGQAIRCERGLDHREITMQMPSDEYVTIEFESAIADELEGSCLVNGPENCTNIYVSVQESGTEYPMTELMVIDLIITHKQAQSLGITTGEGEWGNEIKGKFSIKGRFSCMHVGPNSELVVTLLGEGVPDLSEESFYDYGN